MWQLHKGEQSPASLKREIQGISQKMLTQHLKELTDCGVAGKITYEGYPLKVGYYLTKRGERIFEAVSIMQSVGIEIMLEDGKEEGLRGKGLI